MHKVFKHLEYNAVFLCRGNHLVALREVERHGLLHGDVLLCPAGGNREFAVQMVRNEQLHTGYCGVGQHCLVGVVDLWNAVFRGKALRRLRVFVVNAPELGVLATKIARNVQRRNATAADEHKFHFFHKIPLFHRLELQKIERTSEEKQKKCLIIVCCQSPR
ncbi:hypothetical protein SDC9_121252 [bioreactor metagenome]|uniref:Uncharacterized protein n=1 Tax=bioreactor metagenome TaxID=1076179 RepID=A0A645CBE9_9ZZZZ